MEGLSCRVLPVTVAITMELLNVKDVFLSKISQMDDLEISIFLLLPELTSFRCNDCGDLRRVRSTNTVDVTSSRLMKIDFSQNPKLEILPLSEILKIQAIRELDCSKCQLLVSPPKEVSIQGGENTIKFLRAVENKGAFNKNLTLFFLGDGEAGKTSVFRALKSDNGKANLIREDHRTVGIDLEEWDAANDITFRVLDLAGQAVYETTHQFFLQQRAVYLLVWRAYPVQDGRLGILTERISHWLEALQMRIPGARVLLVVTHIDTVDTVALETQCFRVQETVRERLEAIKNWDRLGSRVPIIEVYRNGESQPVNCLIGEGVAQLREKLFSFTRSMPWYKEALPESWLEVRKEVDNLVKNGRKHLSLEEWRDLAIGKKMEGDMFAIGTMFMHETGILRYFGDIDMLKNLGSPALKKDIMHGTMFIDVRWMVSVLKGLIRHDRQALQDFFLLNNDVHMLRRVNRLNACGRLHQDLLPFLWPCNKISRGFWSSVRGGHSREKDLWSADVVSDEKDLNRAIELLRGFDLMVLDSIRSEYLVPSVLPIGRRQVTADAFCDEECPLTATVNYPKLPPSAFQRIVVCVAGQVAAIEFSVSVAVCYLEGNIGRLTFTQDISTGQVSVNLSSSGKKLLSLLKKELLRMEDFFPGLCRIEDLKENFSSPEAAQITIFGTDEESILMVEKAFKGVVTSSSDYGLLVETRLASAGNLQEKDLKRLRVLMVLISPGFVASRPACLQIQDIIKSGRPIKFLPVLLAGSDAVGWGVSDLKFFQSLDLKSCSHRKQDLEAEISKAFEEQWETILHEKLRMHEDEEWIRMATCHCFGKRAKPFEEPKKMSPEDVSRSVEGKLKEQHQEAVKRVQEDLPRIVFLLNSWRAHEDVDRILEEEGVHRHDIITCPTCSKFEFSLKKLQRQWESVAMDMGGTSINAKSGATITCQECLFEHKLADLLAVPEVRPCPVCERHNAASPGVFYARECRALFHEDLGLRTVVLNCAACVRDNRPGLVHILDVFPPDVFASLCHDEGSEGVEEAAALLREVEAQADVLVWLRASTVSNWERESLVALQRASVLLVLLSDAYLASRDCAREFAYAVSSGKPVVPILLPPVGSSRGWTGSTDVSSYWQCLTGGGGAWTALRKYEPVVWRAADGREQVAQRVAGLVASRIHRAVRLRAYFDMPMLGLRLSRLEQLVDQWGGPAALAGLSTTQVMERFVKPATEKSSLSWCEQALSEQEEGGGGVGTAEWFVSHAWQYLLLDVLEALRRFFAAEGGGDPVVWFDVLSVSQHKTEDRPFEWWNTAFLSAVGLMGRVVMVLQPWDAPVTLCRAWCVFELFAAQSTRSDFRVAMTQSEADRLATAMLDDGEHGGGPAALLRVLDAVRCKEAEASKEEDRQLILDHVSRTLGFDQLDSLVIRVTCQAICDQLARGARATSGSGSSDDAAAAQQRWVLRWRLAELHWLRRDGDAAVEGMRECLDQLPASVGPELQLRACVGLATVLGRLGRTAEALELSQRFESGLTAAACHPGDSQQAAAAALRALAALWRGEVREAEQQVAVCEASEGLHHDSAAQGLLAAALEGLGRAGDAEARLEACAALRKARLGPRHPDALDAMERLACLRGARGDTAGGEAALRTCLCGRERVLGADHPDAEAARHQLSAMLEAVGHDRDFLPSASAAAAAAADGSGVQLVLGTVGAAWKARWGGGRQLTVDSALEGLGEDLIRCGAGQARVSMAAASARGGNGQAGEAESKVGVWLGTNAREALVRGLLGSPLRLLQLRWAGHFSPLTFSLLLMQDPTLTLALAMNHRDSGLELDLAGWRRVLGERIPVVEKFEVQVKYLESLGIQ